MIAIHKYLYIITAINVSTKQYTQLRRLLPATHIYLYLVFLEAALALIKDGILYNVVIYLSILSTD